MNNFSIRRHFAAGVAATLAVIFGGGLLAPNMAAAQTSKEKARQKDKNLMRNLGVGAGAAAVYEGVRGHTTNALVLGAGAALAGKKYEDARKAQSKESSNKRTYRYRNGKRIGYYTYSNGKRYYHSYRG